MYGGCWSAYIHERPNIGNALRGPFTGTQSEKDGSNKARMLSRMSLGVISTKQITFIAKTAFQTLKEQLSSALGPTHFNLNRQTKVSADSSSYGLGRVLPKQGEDCRPVFYA